MVELYGLPDLIKINVEGGEFDVISSLHQKVPSLCFEWASETKDITYNCLDYLYALGFNDFIFKLKINMILHLNQKLFVRLIILKNNCHRLFIKEIGNDLV